MYLQQYVNNICNHVFNRKYSNIENCDQTNMFHFKFNVRTLTYVHTIDYENYGYNNDEIRTVDNVREKRVQRG